MRNASVGLPLPAAQGIPVPGTAQEQLSSQTTPNGFAGQHRRDAAHSRVLRPAITPEAALYTGILLLGILSRFWDLGSRALHHDESLHAYFSWLLATGQGYVHDPLMHGPFLFHITALVFAIFGDSDASSRYPAALFGVILIGLPILLRGERQLGRWGALTASALLLISPAILYQSRYLRHDIFTLVGALYLFICIVRYVEFPQRRWLVGMGVALGFLVANHEIVFGIAAIFLAVIGGALLWGPLRRLAPLAVVSGAAALALVAIVPKRTRPLPDIPWEAPTQASQFAYYQALLTHPLVILLAVLALVTLAAAALLLRWRRDPEMVAAGWGTLLFGDPPSGSVATAVKAAWRDHAGVSWALIAGLNIFVVLFTTLFTNLYGLASGTIATDGTLLYWLGQHDVRRGEQPWFYYMLLFPQYEFIAVLFGSIATIAIAIRAVLVGLGRATAGPRFFFHMLLAAWFSGIFLALSWAGEKMPWLVTHITLPAILLAAALLAEVWRRWAASGFNWSTAQWLLCGGLVTLAASWFLLAAPLTYGEFMEAGVAGGWERVVTAQGMQQWWLLTLPPLVGILAVALVWWRRGARAAAQPALLALLLVLALAQIHVAWRMVYQEGDIPKDMLVYTQTSPDMHRMTQELTTLSEMTTGGLGLEIWYDDGNGTSWPMQWYLRNFPNRRLYSRGAASTLQNAPIVLVAGDNRAAVEPSLQGYTAQTYVLRWWFPESLYRDFAIAPEIQASQSALRLPENPKDLPAILRSIATSVSALGTVEGQQHLYRLVMYRDLPVPIGAYTYTMYIRNDLLPLYNEIRY